MTVDPALDNLHTLAVSLEAMGRLLGRRAADGTLVLADRALIEAAIDAGRQQVASVRTMLAEVPYDPADPWRRSVDSLIATAATVDGLLSILEEMLLLAIR